MRKISLLMALFIFTGISAKSQLYSLFKANTYTDKDGKELLYRFMEPAISDAGDEKFPLVIFLHGAGERGDNNQAQLKHVMSRFVTRDMRNKYPAYMIVPQCPKEKAWSNFDRGNQLRLKKNPAEEGRLVMELLEEVLKKYPIDEQRIYIGGLSMGGFGTWDLVARYPDKFAAAFPICGGGDPTQAEKYLDIPLWCFHGADDTVVPAELSRQMIQAIKAKGGSPIYTEFERTGHDSWSAAFDENPFVYDWLFSQRKN